MDTRALKQRQAHRNEAVRRASTSSKNVGTAERVGSVLGGVLLSGLGVTRLVKGSYVTGGLLGLAGLSLVERGATGWCQLYGALGVNTAVPPEERTIPGLNLVATVTIDRSPGDLYRIWRDLERLPRILSNVEKVDVTGARSSHWVVTGPFGKTIAFDAEITKEREGELLGWKSLENADLEHAGSVRFEPIGDGSSTELTVTIHYAAPGGRAGLLLAQLFGEDPEITVQEDLEAFKAEVESSASETGGGSERERKSSL